MHYQPTMHVLWIFIAIYAIIIYSHNLHDFLASKRIQLFNNANIKQMYFAANNNNALHLQLWSGKKQFANYYIVYSNNL